MLKDRVTRNTEKTAILASILPEINCLDGCSVCCTAGLGVNWTDRVGKVDWLFCNPPQDCGRLKDDKCEIFHERPFICRIFFKSEGGLRCFAGIEPEFLLSEEAMRRIIWCVLSGTIQDAKALRAEYMRKGDDV